MRTFSLLALLPLLAAAEDSFRSVDRIVSRATSFFKEYDTTGKVPSRCKPFQRPGYYACGLTTKMIVNPAALDYAVEKLAKTYSDVSVTVWSELTKPGVPLTDDRDRDEAPVLFLEHGKGCTTKPAGECIGVRFENSYLYKGPFASNVKDASS
jgi:hypothetical protein